MWSVTAAMNLATLHRTAPTRFLLQEHHATKTHLIQGIDIPTLQGTDHTPLTMVTDMGDISTNHNHTAIPTMTGAAVSEGTHHAPHPDTAAACTALWPIDSPNAIYTVTHPNGIVTHHPTPTTSPIDITHATIPQSRAGPAPATSTTLTGNTANKDSQAMPKTFNPPINLTIPRLLSSRTPHQILPQIQTAI